jgi:hypothetical protein
MADSLIHYSGTMSHETDGNTAGKNVTARAAPKRHRGTLRFAIEFPLDEFEAIEAASNARGVSVAEFVRETLRQRLRQKSRLAVKE